MERKSLGNWLRFGSLGLLSFAFAGLLGSACTPVGRDFTPDTSSSTGMGQVCKPGTTTSCYSGTPGTEDIGVCRAGTKTCVPEGTGFDACEGEIVPSTEICTTSEDEACDGPNPVECPSLQHVWSKSFGGMGEDLVTAIAVDPVSGDVFGTGYFYEKIDFGGGLMGSTGGQDVFLFRMTADGQHVWSKRFGDGDTQNAQAIALDSKGAIYITGEIYGSIDFGDGKVLTSKGSADAFVAKFDGATGNMVWARLFGDMETQRGKSIAVTPTNQIVVAGTFNGFIQLASQDLTSSMNSTDMFVIKLDDAGFDVGARSYGSVSSDELYDVTVDSKGAVLVAGSFSQSIQFGQLGKSISAGDDDAFVLKLKDDLSEEWVRTYGDVNQQRAGSVITSPTDDVFLMGDFAGSIALGDGTTLDSPMMRRSVFLISLTPDGALRWGKSTGNAQSFFARQMLTSDTASQAIYAVGFYDGALNLGGQQLDANMIDSFVAKIGWDGTHISSQRFGGPLIDAFFDVATSPAGGLFVCGAHQGPADFGGGVILTPAGPEDIQALLIRLLP